MTIKEMENLACELDRSCCEIAEVDIARSAKFNAGIMFKHQNTKKSECIFLGTDNKCKIYELEHRPLKCKTYPYSTKWIGRQSKAAESEAYLRNGWCLMVDTKCPGVGNEGDPEIAPDEMLTNCIRLEKGLRKTEENVLEKREKLLKEYGI